MRTSKAGIALIKSFEGYRPRAVPLGDGRWTIGYGHTKSAREGLKITRAEAEGVLRAYDLPPIELFIRRSILSPINQNEFDALVSFAFNLGLEAFRTSDVLETFNTGDHLRTADLMNGWRQARINGRLVTVDALVRRRAAERALFLEHPAGRPIAPSPVIRPERAGALPIADEDVVDAPLDAQPDVADKTVNEPRPTKTKEPEPRATSPEAAAKAVTERLTRILGERTPKDQVVPAMRVTPKAPPPERIDGPTEDEVRQAVSALAGIEPVERDPDELEPVESVSYFSPPGPETPSKPDDLPPVETALGSPSALRTPVIDDLEPAPLDPDAERAALKAINGGSHETELSPGVSWAPFAALAVAGGALAGWGLTDMLASGGRGADRGSFGGILAALVGVLLVAVMGYYAVRTLLSRNRDS